MQGRQEEGCPAPGARGRAQHWPPSGERGTRRPAAGGEGAGRGLQLSELQGAERSVLRPEPSAGLKKGAGDRAKKAIEGARQARRRPGPAPAGVLTPREGRQRVSAAAGPQHPGAPHRERAGAGREGEREGGKGAGARQGRSPSCGRARREMGAHAIPWSEPGHGKLCPGGESEVRGGRRKLVSGRGASGLD